jgi:hypothetical protein
MLRIEVKSAAITSNNPCKQSNRITVASRVPVACGHVRITLTGAATRDAKVPRGHLLANEPGVMTPNGHAAQTWRLRETGHPAAS